MSTGSVHALALPYLEQHPPVGRLRLLFGDVRIDVHSNSGELLEKLGGYFQSFLASGGEPDIEVTAIQRPVLDLGLDYTVKQPEPGKTKIKEEYLDLDDGRIIRKRLTGMVFFLAGDTQAAMGPCIENDNQVINFINNRFIERLIKRGSLLFHASGVALRGKGLNMAGFAGMGKSTLALNIMCQGTDFVSNDRVMVEPSDGGLMMHGVPKMPRVNPGTVLHNESLRPVIPEAERERFEQLPPEQLWDLEHKYDALIEECFGEDKFTLSCPMRALVLLNWQRDGSTLRIKEVDLSERRDLMPAFMKELGLFFEWDERTRHRDMSDNAYIQLLRDCPVFELSGGVDFDKAADFCVDFLKKA
ncbi:HprK-related kinase B [Desulfohalovibrio reitneri]|uniref:HprK-related kinase B n=1 Tax=Desulfohalovibrio reitneri TaxID=1307759 RepID=UPI0004A6BEE0|nr:HprK-related kinase B [Desulfohalovibrio reitneri]